MAWIDLLEGDYLLRMTDGFVGQSGSTIDADDVAFTERLYKLGKRPHLSLDGSRQPPNPLHVWTIQRARHIDDIAQPLGAFFKGEDREDYRVVIIGEGIAGMERPYVTNWNSWLYGAGMRHKKRHENRAEVRTAGETLLGVMQDDYNDTGHSPTKTLIDFSVNVTFTGDPK